MTAAQQQVLSQLHFETMTRGVFLQGWRRVARASRSTETSTAPDAFPVVPIADFAVFRATCRRLLDRASFSIVDRTFVAALDETLSWLGPQRVIREQFRSMELELDELVFEDGRVTGILARGRAGVAVEERARIVVGADGRNSMVARAVNAATYRARPALACAYYTYWSDLTLEAFEAYYPPHRAILNFPTDANLACSIVEWPRAEFERVRADVETEFWRALELAPGLFERLRSVRRVATIRGTGDLPNFFRTPFGPGWALVGDAGYHKDPLPAQGISDAFRDADLLSQAIDGGLSGRRRIEEALADYQCQRDEASSAMYELTCQRATLEQPAHTMTSLLRALVGNQPDTDRFIGMVIGTVPIPEFLAPENVQRIMSTPAPV